ncbi:hypothetical protein HDU86_001512 [Geranomyces michiganensis]|nr:hypothetical protein HDU86_001512 [Geranomyces michiganensis]
MGRRITDSFPQRKDWIAAHPEALWEDFVKAVYRDIASVQRAKAPTACVQAYNESILARLQTYLRNQQAFLIEQSEAETERARRYDQLYQITLDNARGSQVNATTCQLLATETLGKRKHVDETALPEGHYPKSERIEEMDEVESDDDSDEEMDEEAANDVFTDNGDQEYTSESIDIGVFNPGATAFAVENGNIQADNTPSSSRQHSVKQSLHLLSDCELLTAPNVRSTTSVRKNKPKKIRDDKNKGSRVTATVSKKRSYEDDDEHSEESKGDGRTALERSMAELSANYESGSNTFSEECRKLWQNYLAQVERRRMSPNLVQAQKGQHQTLMAKCRSAAQALTLGPISANLTTLAANFDLLSAWDKLWSRKADFAEQFISSVAAELFVDHIALAALAFEVEADTKVPATCILSDIVAFLGTKLT